MKAKLCGLFSLALAAGSLSNCAKPAYIGENPNEPVKEFPSEPESLALELPPKAPETEEPLTTPSSEEREEESVSSPAASDQSASSEPEKPVEEPTEPANAQLAARKELVRREITELSEKIDLASSQIDEAKSFLDELTEVYAEEDQKAAKMRADRVYARMRRSSSCGSCAPPPPKAKIGGISTSKADRIKVLDSLERQIRFYQGYLEKDEARMEQLVTYAESLES